MLLERQSVFTYACYGRSRFERPPGTHFKCIMGLKCQKILRFRVRTIVRFSAINGSNVALREAQDDDLFRGEKNDSNRSRCRRTRSGQQLAWFRKRPRVSTVNSKYGCSQQVTELCGFLADSGATPSNECRLFTGREIFGLKYGGSSR
jgi:hypothetical protein